MHFTVIMDVLGYSRAGLGRKLLQFFPLVVSHSLYADFKRPALSVSARFEKHNEKGRLM